MYSNVVFFIYFGCVKQSKPTRTHPMSIRLTPEVEERLTKTAASVKMTKNALAQAAIEAAVEAIEKAGGRLVLPLELTTTHEAVAKQEAPTVIQGPTPAAKTAGLPKSTIYEFPGEDSGLKVAEP